MIHIKFNYSRLKLSYSVFSIFSNVREVNLVYPIHNGSCHKQQMINNDKLNHGKPQLQLWIDSLNEMFLSRWTAGREQLIQAYPQYGVGSRPALSITKRVHSTRSRYS